MTPVTAPEPAAQAELREETPPNAIELGWLILGDLDETRLAAIEQARARTEELLRRRFPELDWRLSSTRRVEPPTTVREKPVTLLEHGVAERDRRGWDFVLVLTGSDIAGRDNPFTLGVPSRSIGVAAASTARIDPWSSGTPMERERRVETLARRLAALVLHLFGHLNGLEHDEDPRSWMYDLADPSDLDVMERWTDECAQALGRSLAQVADQRLEERPGRRGALAFYAGAVRLNWTAVLSAIAAARPWLLPAKLSRFTAAACSALLILLVTAEIWEVGLHQSGAVVTVLAATALTAITLFMLARQRLLLSPGRRGLTEQIAITNVAVVLSVVIGLLTTFAALFLLGLAVAFVLVPSEVVSSWTAGDAAPAGRSYVVLSGFVASLGISIGALGASFEEQDYLRHVAYVDEET